MKTFLLTVAALALSAGIAFAENPNFGDPGDGPDYPGQQIDTNTGTNYDAEPATDYTATSDIGLRTAPSSVRAPVYVQSPANNPAANRFGDASPQVGQ
ncbi:hypothetical protein GCM10011491_17250 [Brucella endophytica]|uniref:DUF680 domain-containing protein n=1 Tax=Brucella endophytica TaxID=1963359 RepID=A0A916S996_9HYPH|nr:hypothetical protein [Brucella endophytica]GGA89914.1 hypothetical protein GCM10011491_17250 [Brucella endophytica]